MRIPASAEGGMLDAPVLLLAFNRPDLTRRVLDALAAAPPRRLYVAVDGPRPDHPDDVARCAAVRELVRDVPWIAKSRTLFRDRNLGLRRAVTEALDWFFEAEPAGIILEDDCVPDPSFFPYCAQLLARYADDDRVMVVSGNDYHPPAHRPPHSYSFTRYPYIWGWATWRRAWRCNDPEMTDWVRRRGSGWLLDLGDGSPEFAAYWTDRFDDVAAGRVDSWAYVWIYSCWSQAGLATMPTSNLVRNIGFGADATHTVGPDWRSTLDVRPMSFPLRHPERIEREPAVDRWADRHVYGIGTRNRSASLRRWVGRVPGLRTAWRSLASRRQ